MLPNKRFLRIVPAFLIHGRRLRCRYLPGYWARFTDFECGKYYRFAETRPEDAFLMFGIRG